MEWHKEEILPNLTAVVTPDQTDSIHILNVLILKSASLNTEFSIKEWRDVYEDISSVSCGCL